MENKFICPSCNTEWNRNGHYTSIVNTQNLINALMGNDKIIDMCGKCNHFVYEEENNGKGNS